MFRSTLEKEITHWNLPVHEKEHLFSLLSIKYGQAKEYRNQCRFYIREGKLFQRSMLTHELFPVTACTVITEQMLQLAKIVARKIPKQYTEFELRENSKGEHLCTIYGELIPQALSLPVDGLFFYNTAEKTYHHLMGSTTLSYTMNVHDQDFLFHISASSFFQVHTEIAEKLYGHIIDLLPSTGLVWDYFSGTGTIGIIAAKLLPNIQVEGIELREDMVEMAMKNASSNNVHNFTSRKENLTQISLESASPASIVLDPPRNGLGKHLCEELIRVQSPDMIYVSCNPATFFEDMRILCSTYTVKSITLYDMMPFTSHTELVAHLTRRKTLE